MRTIIPLMTRKANERRRRWKMSSSGILLPRGQVVLSDLSLLATRSRNLLLAGMKIQMWDGAAVEVEAQDHIPALHCTGPSDSRNEYSVSDHPSSRGPANP